MRRHHLQARGFAHDGEVRLEAACGQRPRTGLRVLFIGQAGKHNLRVLRTRLGPRHIAKRHEHRRRWALRVARAATVKPAVAAARDELLFAGGIDGIQMGGEQDALLDSARRREHCQQVGATRVDCSQFHVQPGLCCGCGQELGHALFTRERACRPGERGVHAR